MLLTKSLFLLIFCTIFITEKTVATNTCYNDNETNCPPKTGNCLSQYGGIKKLKSDLEQLAYINLENSMGFLKMSTFMKNYIQNREGFEKLYKKMSNAGWDHGIDLINYLAKRGSETTFPLTEKITESKCFETFINCPQCTEAQSIGYYERKTLLCAHDKMKQAVVFSSEIHKKATSNEQYDPDITSYLEDHFINPYTEKLRELTSHIDVLNKQLNHLGHHEEKLSVFLIDEYLSELYS